MTCLNLFNLSQAADGLITIVSAIQIIFTLKMRLSKGVMIALVASNVDAGPISYAVCQTKCAALTLGARSRRLGL